MNGARVYVVALPGDAIEEKVVELNQLGQEAGGTAEGYHVRMCNFNATKTDTSRIACDISSKDAIEELVATISQKETHLDMLISNAGIRRDPPISCNVLTSSLGELQASMWSSRQSDWEDTFRVNTIAHYFLSVACLPLLVAAAERDLGNGRKGRDEGRGVVIMTSSCASMHNATNVDLTSYATSKAATDHLVKLLAAKFSRFYIRVLSINPGCTSNSHRCDIS